MISISDIYPETIKYFKSLIGSHSPDSAIILGSGLGELLEGNKILFEADTSTIPGYPVSTVSGHKGKIQLVSLQDKVILTFSGRIHPYEGYRLSQCLLPVHLSHIAGVKNIIITNAAGGVNPSFTPGNLMLITGINPAALKKSISEFFGTPLADISSSIRKFPDSLLYKQLKEIALDEKIHLQEGVYWYMSGPNYETPAEIRMIQKSGGDAVGMSSVHEILYALAMGKRTVGISCITNMGAGISPVKLNHAEVKETAEKVKDLFSRYLRRVLVTL